MGRKIFAYARINVKSENIDDEVSLIKKYCRDNDINIEDREFIVEDSENLKSREGYDALCNYMMRSGDALIISELDRLGKEVINMREEWVKLNKEGIELLIINNPLISTYNKTQDEKAIINSIATDLLVYISDKEKAKIKRKQAEGIQLLKEKNNGKGIGRPKTKINKEFKEQYKLWKGNKQTAVQTFKNLNMTKATFYRMVKEYELNKEKE